MCCAKGFIVFLIAALTVALPLETCAQVQLECSAIPPCTGVVQSGRSHALWYLQSPGTKAAFTQRAQELFLREAGSNGRFANRSDASHTGFINANSCLTVCVASKTVQYVAG